MEMDGGMAGTTCYPVDVPCSIASPTFLKAKSSRINWGAGRSPFPNLSEIVRFRSISFVFVGTKSDFADGGPGTCSAECGALMGPTQRPDMPAIAGVLASPSPRSSPAYNASKSKFRNLSKQIPAGASLAFGEPSPHSSWQQQLTTWQQQLTTSFSRTFDSKAEATRSGDKTSIGLNARLARASMTNLDVGSKSCDFEWQQQHNVDGRLRRGPHSHSGTS